MDIVKEVKTLLNVNNEFELDCYFSVDDNEYCAWSRVGFVNLFDVDGFYNENISSLDLYTTVQPLTEEEHLFLSISEGQVYVSHDKFLETLRSLINDKG